MVYLLLLLFSCSVVSDSLPPHRLQHYRLPYPSPAPGACSNSCPLSWWCHQPAHPLSFPSPPAFYLSFPTSRCFLMSQLFTSGSQSIGTSASASVLPLNIQDWFPLGLTSLSSLPSLQSKGLSRVFSKTQFKSINSLVLSLLHGSNVTSIHNYWKNHSFDCTDLCQQNDVSSAF